MNKLLPVFVQLKLSFLAEFFSTSHLLVATLIPAIIKYTVNMLNLLALCRSNESLAHCLNSFHELMDHGEVSWDILTHGFIKNVIIMSYDFSTPSLTTFLFHFTVVVINFM